MTAQQARALVAALRSAYPSKQVGEDTLRLWTAKLKPLDYQRARLAVIDLIDTMTFWPSIAEFHDAYRAHRPKPAPEQEELPELTEEQRQANLKHLRALQDSLGLHDIGLPPVGLGACDECGRRTERYAFAQFALCSPCVGRRQRAAREAA